MPKLEEITTVIEDRGVSLDSRTIKPGEVFIAIKGNNFDGHDFIPQAIKKGASAVIYQAGQKNKLAGLKKNVIYIEVEDTVRALGDIAQAHRLKFNIPVIAITGSNGKTTAKEMVGWVLSKRCRLLKNEGTFNNHIGVPITLLRLKKNHDVAVLELGTNHFGEIERLSEITSPNIAVLTNIGESHLESFRDLEGVLREKCALLDNLRQPAIAVLNLDDILLKNRVASDNGCFTVGFSVKEKAEFTASKIHVGQRLKFTINGENTVTLNTVAWHNIYNALLAAAVGRIFGLSYQEIVSALNTFKFPEGRMNLLKFRHTALINDTYNSNPFSLRHALATLARYETKGKRILIMGDMLELGEQKEEFHRQAGIEAAKICDILITVGGLSRFAAEAARENGFDAKKIFTCDSSIEARGIFMRKLDISRNDVVLIKGSRAMKMERVFQG